jgi:F-type H+-transporting ATPase subunit delta
MSAKRVAIRYAKALIDVLSSNEALDQIESFQGFCNMVAANRELEAMFANVTINPKDKAGVAAALLEKWEAPETIKRFVSVLALNGRLDLLREVDEAVRRERDAELGISPVMLTCAVTPSREELDSFRKGMEQTLGCSVRLETREDPTILGGVVARVGSMIYDGSISGRLSRLRRELVKESE